ncbi:hypothetical protein LXL04_035829 [Taraxacum kok-saghyz]
MASSSRGYEPVIGSMVGSKNEDVISLEEPAQNVHAYAIVLLTGDYKFIGIMKLLLKVNTFAVLAKVLKCKADV